MAHTDITKRRTSWWERLGEHCYRVSTPQLVRDMQNEASLTFGELINDLGAPLDATFEREVARQMNQGAYLAFVPAETLLPVMMQRLGLEASRIAEDSDFRAMRRTCNACPVAGHCWRAMRRDAGVEECRGFCPNAGPISGSPPACRHRASVLASGFPCW